MRKLVSQKALAAAIASVFSLASQSLFATVFVTNCNDDGSGSLRNAVAGAPSGEVVDASALAGVCSTITLKTGAIAVNQTSLTIKGSGAANLSVSAKYSGSTNHQYQNRIFTHEGTGTLYLEDMTVTKGYQVASTAVGGCIYSRGSVILKDTTVTLCRAVGGTTAIAGGIFALQRLTMKESTLSLNTATLSAGDEFGQAGGAKAAGFRAYYSSVLNNVASNKAGNFGVVGGISSTAEAYIINSTVGANKSYGNVGGLLVSGAMPVKIINSTISSNAAKGGHVGGAYLKASSVQITNSTITGNTALNATAIYPAGVMISAQTVVMQSSIVANNLYGSPPTVDSDLSSTATITGANNLIQQSNASLPVDTIFDKCSFLGPLKDNGGLILTNALLGHSPAIDAGNNSVGISFDQRGPQSVNGEANYPRVIGAPDATTPRPDIGAYEVDRTDEIYDADFDSC
jgi:hypothetical protein